MEKLVNLKGSLREFWDENITRELTAAGIEIHTIPYCDSPQYTGVASITGKLGEWIFSRDLTSYSFWGDVPLTMAKRIAADDVCKIDCIPFQWRDPWDPIEMQKQKQTVLEQRISWIAPDGFIQEKDAGYSEGAKEAYIHDANGRLRFMDDPSIGAEAFIRTYTFFTLAALNRFVEISNEERVPYKYIR